MKMPFGKYRGLPLRDLPDDYIDWLHSLDDLHGRLRKAVESEWQYRQWEEESRRCLSHIGLSQIVANLLHCAWSSCFEFWSVWSVL